MRPRHILLLVLGFTTWYCQAQSNLFINPNEGSGSTGGSSGSAHIPSPSPSGGTGGDSSFDPNATVSFDRRMTFSAHVPVGGGSTSQFLVNTEKGYMGMDREMMERFANVEFPDNDDFRVHYRVTSSNGKTYYFVEIQGQKQILNRLPGDQISVDQTNLSPQKFRDNFSPTGSQLNVSSQNYDSKEYKGISADTGEPVYVYLAEQNATHLNPVRNENTVGVFGLGYIYHDNKTQVITRVENDHGTAELERIENINISINGNTYRKHENVVQEEERTKSNVVEDVLTKRQESINRMPDNELRAKEQEMQDLEREREHKRKEAMNKYIDHNAPVEKQTGYALESFDPKDDITLRKLECEKRVLELNKTLSRMSSTNPDRSRLQNEKACQEQKILDYKSAETEMIAIKERYPDDLEKANVEKMNYYFSNVVPNIYARRCGNN